MANLSSSFMILRTTFSSPALSERKRLWADGSKGRIGNEKNIHAFKAGLGVSGNAWLVLLGMVKMGDFWRAICFLQLISVIHSSGFSLYSVPSYLGK